MKFLKAIFGERGFSLAELLIVLAIFVLVAVAVFSIQLLAGKGYREGETLMELNQNGRIVLEKATRELRQAREIVTELKDTREEATSSIEFEDGHLAESYHYIRYFKDGREVKREEKKYYFESCPDIFQPWNASSTEEDLQTSVVKGPQTIGEYVSELDFWAEDEDNGNVSLFILLEKENKKTELRTEVFGRNL